MAQPRGHTQLPTIRRYLRRLKDRCVKEFDRLERLIDEQLEARRTSPVVGVAAMFDKGRQSGWCAYWCVDGKQVKKRFSFAKYGGRHKALLAAVKHRKEHE
jgi:hypothetical protein